MMLYAIADDVVFETLAGEAVLLQMRTGVYFELNAVATRAWSVLEQRPRTVDELVASLKDAFAVDEDRLRSDLESLLGSLQQEGLVTLEARP